ncbi:MAG: TrmH family RNA methyltransferase [Flavobacteriaceae bacterium]|nr:TrmH family RNA methyltransferase [Flavobacteriaceae bacterium]
MEHISSINNKNIKLLRTLNLKSRIRKEKQIFIIEGLKETKHSIDAGYEIFKIFTTKKYLKELESNPKLNQLIKKNKLITIDDNIYKGLCYRSKTTKLLAIAKSKKHDLNSLVLKNKNPLILILESIEKPGNIGAIIRTVNAAKIDLLMLSNLKTDLYNPNIIRSSVGCLFNTPIVISSSDEILSFIKKNNINLYSSTIESNSISFLEVSYKKGSAIAMGTEDKGLSKKWFINSKKNIKIPMLGYNNSLNVSVATGIIIYEALRQRNMFENLGS